MSTFSERIPIALVASNGRLARTLRAVSPRIRWDPVRFRTISGALAKTGSDFSPFILVQWSVEEIVPGLSQLETARRQEIQPFRIGIYCPELPSRTVSENEAIRFALLEAGATAVWAHARELSQLLTVFKRHTEQFPLPSKHWTMEIRDSLPWND